MEAWQLRHYIYETETLGLDTFGRMEFRALDPHSGPPPQWSLQELTLAWQDRNGQRPLPRPWRAMAHDGTEQLREQAGLEFCHHHAYSEALQAYLDSCETPQSRPTQRRKHQQASDSLHQLRAAQLATEHCFQSLGIEPPPPEPYTPLPDLPQPRRNAKPNPQHPMHLQGVATVAKAPRRPAQPKPVQPAAEPPPNLRFPI